MFALTSLPIIIGTSTAPLYFGVAKVNIFLNSQRNSTSNQKKMIVY